MAALSLPALALDPNRALTQYVLDVWTTEQGLPTNRVSTITQTADGYLWLITGDGLVRFDGVRFTLFDEKRTGVEGRVSAYAHSDGSLWLATQAAGAARMKDGVTTRFTTKDGLLTDELITGRAFAPGRDGSLLIASRKGVVRFSGGRFTTVVAQDLTPWSYALPAEDREGTVWIGTAVGLYRVRDGRVERLTTADGLPDDDLSQPIPGRDGSLWIGTLRGGVARLKDGTFTSISTKQGLPSNFTNSLLEDRDGNLWIGTNSGLCRWSGGKLATFPKESALSTALIIDLFEDREGSLWIGTASARGLYRLRDGKVITYGVAEGLVNDIATAALEDRTGSIWITTLGGLSRLANGTFTSFTAKDGLATDATSAATEDGAGGIWIGTADGASRWMDGRFTHFTEKDGVRKEWPFIVPDHDGNLWVTAPEGLTLIDANGQRTSFGEKDGLPRGSLRRAFVERDGTLWVSSKDGLYRRGREGKFAPVTIEGLPSSSPMVLSQDRDGGLWVGGGGLLHRLKAGRLTRFSQEQGFPHNPFGADQDDRGDYWMPSNQGIFRVSRADVEALSSGTSTRVTPLVFDTVDGMRDAECNGSRSAKSRDGRLWYAAQGGVVVIDPARIPRNTLEPPVHVEEVVADGHEADRRGSMRLGPGVDRLDVHYTATSLLVPGRVRFQYRLEGYDRGWVDAGTERVAHYTNLPPRAYTFRVKACNDDGVWNETGSSLTFKLLPRFWQTWWFHGLEGLAGLAGLAGVLVLQRRRVLARADHERKTEELEQARRVQLALLPKQPLRVGGWTVAGSMQTATEVGGDYYGYLESKGRLCVVIADATGHGMTSGLVAGMLKAVIASLSTKSRDEGPAQWLENLNDALRGAIAQRGLGVCAGIALVDVESGEVELGMAGIPHPFQVSASGVVTRLPLSGTPLGYLKRIAVATTTRTLAPGERLVLVTDGLMEQTNAAGTEWGFEGLERALAATCVDGRGPADIAEALLAACEGYAAGRSRSDDRTVVVLERASSS